MRVVELQQEEVQSTRRFPNPFNNGDHILKSDLDIVCAICLTLLKDNIMPRCKDSRFIADEKKFIYDFSNGEYMNVSIQIFSELEKR